jgi:hypothetical protein
MGLVHGAMADEPEWVKKSFHPDSEKYVFTVGVGIGNDEITALRESRRHALASFIQAHLSRNAKVAVKTVEGANGVLVDDRVSTEIYELDLTQFEKLDQHVEAKELPVRQVTAKSLYRFPKELLRKYRESMPGRALTSADDEALNRKLAEAQKSNDEREKARIEAEAVYAATYPLLGLEFSLGYLKISSYSFLSAGFGLPMRLRLLSDRILVSPFFVYGFGSTNTTKSEQSNDAENPNYTTALSLGVAARFFIRQGADYGLYLVAQGSQDHVTPTCPKTNAGNCVDRAADPFTQTSYTAGLGFQIPARHPIAFELLYGVPDNRIGVQFQMALPLVR